MIQPWLKFAVVSLSSLALIICPPSFADDDDDDDMSTSSLSDSANSARPPVRRESPVMQEADAMLTKQIREVSSWMENYCSSNVAFPDFGDEMTWVIAQLTELVPTNPYDPDSMSEAESGQPMAVPLEGSSPGGEILTYDTQVNESIAQAQDRIRIKVDSSMTQEQARQYQVNPPDDWEAPAGTITIVSTNQGRNQNSPFDFFLVWGAGANGKPVRDPFTKRVVLVEGRWTQIISK